MDKHTKENWIKIKKALEESNKTDCYFYQRAVAICGGQSDPLEDMPSINHEG